MIIKILQGYESVNKELDFSFLMEGTGEMEYQHVAYQKAIESSVNKIDKTFA